MHVQRSPARRTIAAVILSLCATGAASPADAAASLDGAQMSLGWASPFAGILLSIALGPLFFARFWHRHFGKVTAAWSAATFVALAVAFGIGAAADTMLHAIVVDYIGFIVLLFALYTIAGGILVTGKLGGTPAGNTAALAFGTAIASVIGTTGAAMVLVRPLLRANEGRLYNVHVVVFFVFLVANIGGALSPLGDPPLFVGFLRGVDFFWTTRALFAATALTAAILLAAFFALDWWLYRREAPREASREPIRVRGFANLALIGGVVVAVMLPSVWDPGVTFVFRSLHVPLATAARDLILLLLAGVSVWTTADEHREANGFTWEPIGEVAILFAGIFVCIAPVLAMLSAGPQGAFAWLLNAVTKPDGGPHEIAYFWLTGTLSAFLDNAPTYLVFFELAGGDARELMTAKAATLGAISLGAVFMGALTYIGNAPNLMVYAIANERGVAMPNFFGYMAWSCPLLLPPFALIGWLWFA